MSKMLTIDDSVYEALRRLAEAQGRTPEAHAKDWWEKTAPPFPPPLTEAERERARKRIRRHFGSVASGDPNSADHHFEQEGFTHLLPDA
jgi:hypothetical protein